MKNYAVVRNYKTPPKTDEWYVADSRETANGKDDWLDDDYATRQEAEEVVKAISKRLEDGYTFPEAVYTSTHP